MVRLEKNGGVIDKQNGYFRIIGGLQITFSQHHFNKDKNNWLKYPKKFKTEPVLIITPRSSAAVWHTNLEPKRTNIQTSKDTKITLIAIGEAEE